MTVPVKQSVNIIDLIRVLGLNVIAIMCILVYTRTHDTQIAGIALYCVGHLTGAASSKGAKSDER